MYTIEQKRQRDSCRDTADAQPRQVQVEIAINNRVTAGEIEVDIAHRQRNICVAKLQRRRRTFSADL